MSDLIECPSIEESEGTIYVSFNYQGFDCEQQIVRGEITGDCQFYSDNEDDEFAERAIDAVSDWLSKEDAEISVRNAEVQMVFGCDNWEYAEDIFGRFNNRGVEVWKKNTEYAVVSSYEGETDLDQEPIFFSDFEALLNWKESVQNQNGKYVFEHDVNAVIRALSCFDSPH